MSAEAARYEDVIAQKVESHRDAHFEVIARLDGPPVETVITIDRTLGLFKVRAKRGLTRTLPLSQVAEMVYARAVKEAMKGGRA